MSYSAFLNKAIDIAYAAHEGQTRRDGSQYVLHPLAVSNLVLTSKNSLVRNIVNDMYIAEISIMQSVAVLHDVAEDCDPKYWDDIVKLSSMLNLKYDQTNFIQALELLTHEKSVPYDDYVQRIVDSNNIYAVCVKLLDMEHNSSDLVKTPVHDMTEKQINQLNKYRKATRQIMEAYE